MISCVVVDTETTGIRAADNRVIEIGAVRIQEGRIVDRFGTLVNPGLQVPRRITRLTGIRTTDLADAPTPEDVWRRFRSFAGDSVLVAHNAQFDRAFVQEELRRLDVPLEDAQWLCTVRLSRRLLPGLPSRRLDAVARFLGVPVGVRHRALADAEITAGVLLELAKRARIAGFDGIHGLLALQGVRYATATRPDPHIDRLRSEVVPSLPDRPGVYRMIDARGTVLYVGKATSLRKRVGSYFVAVEAKSARLRDLVRRVRSIQVDATPTEIEARVREARLILKLQPPYNRAQLTPGRRGWVRLATVGGAPDLSIHRFKGTDADFWIGPLASSAEAYGIAGVLAAVSGGRADRPRTRSTHEQARQEQAVRALGRLKSGVSPGPLPTAWSLSSLRDLARDPILAAMKEAADELAFEEARLLRDWLELLNRLADDAVVPLSAGDVLALHGGSAHPSEIVLIRDGLLVGTRQGSQTDRSECVRWMSGLSGLAPVSDFGLAGPDERRARDDERRMLTTWIRRTCARVTVRSDGESLASFAGRAFDGFSETANADWADSFAPGAPE